MLPRSRRLDAFRIGQIMGTGKRIRAQGVSLVYQPGSGMFAFVVSKNTDTRAVVRNRIKRLLREAVQHARVTHLDGVVIGFKELVGKTQAEVSQIMTSLFHETTHS